MDYIVSRDGTKIAYHVKGEGEIIFLFNGFTCNKHSVRRVVNILSTKYKVIYWDYKGHGDSETPHDFEDVTVECSLDDAERVIQKLKIKNAIFIGYSTGVMLTLEYYMRHPEMVKSLILISGFSDKVLSSLLNTNLFSYVGSALHKISPIVPGVIKYGWRAAHSLPFNLRLFVASKTFLNEEKTIKEEVQPYIDSLKDRDLNLLIHFIIDIQNYKLSKPISSVTIPTLLIAGEKDLFVPASRSEEIHKEIIDSEILIVNKASHNILLEEPEIVSNRIFEFLNKHK